MSLIANCGKRIILVAWIIFIFFTWIFSFSFLLFIVLIIVHLSYKSLEREVLDDDFNVVLSPIDAKVKNIEVDEEKKVILLTLIKTHIDIFADSQEIRSVIKTDELKVKNINGLKYSDDFYSNASELFFDKNISCVFKPAPYSIKNIYSLNKARKGQRIGFFSSGEVVVKLPYDSTILVGINDKILANSSIARLGE